MVTYNNTATINSCASWEPDSLVWDESKILKLQPVPTEKLQFSMGGIMIVIIIMVMSKIYSSLIMYYTRPHT